MAKGRFTGGRVKGKSFNRVSKSQKFWNEITTSINDDKIMSKKDRELKKLTVKEYFLAAFEMIQQDPELDLLAFAKKFPSQFYAMATRLIPQEISQQVKHDINITWNEELTFEPNSSAQIENKNYLDFENTEPKKDSE